VNQHDLELLLPALFTTRSNPPDAASASRKTASARAPSRRSSATAVKLGCAASPLSRATSRAVPHTRTPSASSISSTGDRKAPSATPDIEVL